MRDTMTKLFFILCFLAGAGTARGADVIVGNFGATNMLSASDGYLYWTDADTILRRGCVNASGLLSTSIADCGVNAGQIDIDFDVHTPTAFAAGGGFVYWRESDSTDLRRARVDGGTLVLPETIDSTFSHTVLAADMGYLYGIDEGTLKRGRVEQTAAGNTLELIDDLDTTFGTVTAMAATGGFLFFQDSAGIHMARIGPGGLTDGFLLTSNTDINLFAVAHVDGTGTFYHRESSLPSYLYAQPVSAVHSSPVAAELDEPAWLAYVQAAVNTLMTDGLDVYGTDNTNDMIMANIDLNAFGTSNPKAPNVAPYDDIVRLEGRPSDGRFSRGGVNLWHDQPLIKTMYKLATEVPDSAFATAADAYVSDFFQRAGDNDGDEYGALFWGNHTYYDAHADALEDDDYKQHEPLVLIPDLENMYRVTNGFTAQGTTDNLPKVIRSARASWDSASSAGPSFPRWRSWLPRTATSSPSGGDRTTTASRSSTTTYSVPTCGPWAARTPRTTAGSSRSTSSSILPPARPNT